MREIFVVLFFFLQVYTPSQFNEVSRQMRTSKLSIYLHFPGYFSVLLFNVSLKEFGEINSRGVHLSGLPYIE